MEGWFPPASIGSSSCGHLDEAQCLGMLWGRGTYRAIVARGVCQYTEFGVGSSFPSGLSFRARFGGFPLLH